MCGEANSGISIGWMSSGPCATPSISRDLQASDIVVSTLGSPLKELTNHHTTHYAGDEALDGRGSEWFNSMLGPQGQKMSN